MVRGKREVGGVVDMIVKNLLKVLGKFRDGVEVWLVC